MTKQKASPNNICAVMGFPIQVIRSLKNQLSCHLLYLHCMNLGARAGLHFLIFFTAASGTESGPLLTLYFQAGVADGAV